MSEQAPTIRVMLVDDHAVVRSGLSAFLLAFDDLELVGDAADGVEALNLASRVRPDVVLMDLVMPRMDGATATRAIREKFPDTQVIALTSFKEDDLVQDAQGRSHRLLAQEHLRRQARQRHPLRTPGGPPWPQRQPKPSSTPPATPMRASQASI